MGTHHCTTYFTQEERAEFNTSCVLQSRGFIRWWQEILLKIHDEGKKSESDKINFASCKHEPPNDRGRYFYSFYYYHVSCVILLAMATLWEETLNLAPLLAGRRSSCNVSMIHVAISPSEPATPAKKKRCRQTGSIPIIWGTEAPWNLNSQTKMLPSPQPDHHCSRPSLAVCVYVHRAPVSSVLVFCNFDM